MLHVKKHRQNSQALQTHQLVSTKSKYFRPPHVFLQTCYIFLTKV